MHSGEGKHVIVIIDYGMGNLASVKNAFLKLGYDACTSTDPDRVVGATRVVLPGVGAFGNAVSSLRKSGMDRAIHEVVKNRIPFLGICLGLQLLSSESMENGLHKGLDLVPGRVVKLPPGQKVPHMGWNQVIPKTGSRLFQGITPGSYFYFVHSYYIITRDEKLTAATCHYGLDFTCALEKGHLFATQFHPEKSGALGLRILKNFGEMQG